MIKEKESQIRSAPAHFHCKELDFPHAWTSQTKAIYVRPGVTIEMGRDNIIVN